MLLLLSYYFVLIILKLTAHLFFMVAPYNKGDEYEDKIFRILRDSKQVPEGFERAGAGDRPDIVFLHSGKPHNLEVKNALTVDFGQKMLRWSADKKWYWSEDDKITQLYTGLGVLDAINNKNIVPIKFNRPNKEITPTDKKADQNAFKARIDIPFETLVKYYNEKGIFYIQIGTGFGFYHLGKDMANLGTPAFIATLSLRLRAKTLHTSPPSAYAFLAVLKPKTKPQISKFSLEKNSKQKFPPIQP